MKNIVHGEEKMSEKKYIVCNAVTGAVTNDRCDATYIVCCKNCAYGRPVVISKDKDESLYVCQFFANNKFYGTHYCSWGTPKT